MPAGKGGSPVERGLGSGAKSESGVAAQPLLKSASFATFGVAGVISVVAVLSVGHFHVHL
eukprot:COSAG02_NODE_5744_length_4073_cov_4.193256_3_plen_60_part_00